MNKRHGWLPIGGGTFEIRKEELAIGLYKMLEMEFVNNWFTRFCAGAVLVAIPISILFMITQRCYQEAMSGAVKG